MSKEFEELQEKFNMNPILEEGYTTAELFEAFQVGQRAGMERAKTLLHVAQCPNCDGSGGTYDGYGNAEQCQWCCEVDDIFKELEEVK